MGKNKYKKVEPFDDVEEVVETTEQFVEEEPKKGSKEASKEARIAELRANPDRQPADDKELDELLHGVAEEGVK